MGKRECCNHCDCRNASASNLLRLDDDVWQAVKKRYDAVATTGSEANIDWLQCAGRCVFGEPVWADLHSMPALSYKVMEANVRGYW